MFISTVEVGSDQLKYNPKKNVKYMCRFCNFFMHRSHSAKSGLESDDSVYYLFFIWLNPLLKVWKWIEHLRRKWEWKKWQKYHRQQQLREVTDSVHTRQLELFPDTLSVVSHSKYCIAVWDIVACACSVISGSATGLSRSFESFHYQEKLSFLIKLPGYQLCQVAKSQ